MTQLSPTSVTTTLTSPGVRLVEQEARALLVRLGRVTPFAFQQTAVPAAALPPGVLSTIDRYLISGRRKVHQLVVKFIRWLQSPEGRSATPELAQRRFTMLRMRFNVTLAQFDIFADALTQRSEQGTGVLLAGLDAAAADALSIAGNYYKLPGVVCYLDRGHGAAIRRARTRLPGGGENPIAIIRIPRERMIGSGIASSLIHEAGHQAAALLDLIESIRPLLQGMERNGGEQSKAWQYWNRCISEILADFWAVGRVGVTATLGLIGVVTLPRYFVFRLKLDDPHPLPWMRVRLSCAMGRVLYPDGQWDRLEKIWLSYYPPSTEDQRKDSFIALLEATMPGLATLIAHHRPRPLGGLSLKDALETDRRRPALLRAAFKQWRMEPAKIFQASPTMVFAVIGQARAENLITPEEEGQVFHRMLRYWALRDTLDPAVICAKPSAMPLGAPSLFIGATN